MSREQSIGWLTRPRRLETDPPEGISPALLYHKWHGYDPADEHKERREGPQPPSFETKLSRVPWLRLVAERVGRQVVSPDYRRWYERYERTLSALGASFELKAATVWRLVAGFGANPALETGLHLHPLRGFPYLPGSAVKGLVHHVAEMELLEKLPAAAEGAEGVPEEAELERFVAAAQETRQLFGSLVLEPKYEPEDQEKKHPLGPETPRTWLARWRRDPSLAETWKRKIGELLDGHTGGWLSFYDAVPLPGQKQILEPDVLNPHYPDYYGSEGEGCPPSDDQSPVPVYFLAVCPGVKLVFPYRVRRRRGETAPAGASRVGEWLEAGLAEWGAGAKTAAGYGYFSVGEG